MVDVLLAAAALAAASPTRRAGSAPPTPDPAMFVVRDADTTIYLFGTFHALDGQSDWFNDQVKTRVRRVRRAGARNPHSRRPAPAPTPSPAAASGGLPVDPVGLLPRRPRAWRSPPGESQGM